MVEISIMLGVLAAMATRPVGFFALFAEPPTRFFLMFLFLSILSVSYLGFSYALGVVGYEYLKYFLGYMIIASSLDSIRNLRKAFVMMSLAGCLVAYFCLRLYYQGVGVGAGIGTTVQTLNWRGAVQWLGNYGGSNTTALLFISILGFSLGLFFRGERFGIRLFGLLASALIGWAFFLTDSRGGFLAFLAILGGYTYLRMNMRLRTFIPLALALAVLAIVLKPEPEGRGIGESTTPERVELFHQGLQMFKKNPILGVGTWQYPRHNPVGKTAHNFYLATLAETGFFGAVLLTLMYYYPVRSLLKYLHMKEKGTAEYNTAAMIIVALLGVGVCTFFLSAKNEIPYYMLGIAASLPHSERIAHKLNGREVMLIILINILLIATIYTLIQVYFMIFG